MIDHMLRANYKRALYEATGRDPNLMLEYLDDRPEVSGRAQPREISAERHVVELLEPCGPVFSKFDADTKDRIERCCSATFRSKLDFVRELARLGLAGIRRAVADAEAAVVRVRSERVTPFYAPPVREYQCELLMLKRWELMIEHAYQSVHEKN